ncbi:hypothetical protein HJC23_002274 [Cyclotella cryptica]|uniref:SCP2 domain-containing protein n=1 Tax=Cyclotella cryptica TaxID=29204 RepID=A0ABD3QI02_9STRA
MKEMEELVMKKANQTLTKDSIFCNIDFTLGSFQVNLTTAENQPITSLEMDMMSTSFKAKADGSFAFILSLLSLEVSDSAIVKQTMVMDAEMAQVCGHLMVGDDITGIPLVKSKMVMTV